MTIDGYTDADAAVDWDAAADTFDDDPDHGLRDPAAWAARLAEWLPAAPADVLDLGCGTGSLALLAAEQGHHVTAVDSAPRMVERARAKLTGTGARMRADVLLGDASRPPVEGRRFDVVLVRHVLWALPDPEAALRHWCTLLRPGGRLVLVEGVWGEGVRGEDAWGEAARREDVQGVGVRGESAGGEGARGEDVQGESVRGEAVGGGGARGEGVRGEGTGGGGGERGPAGIPQARPAAALAPLAGRVHSERLSSDPGLWGGPVSDERYALVAVVDGVRRHTEVVDVHLIVRRGDEVLLARRAGTGYADGLLHAPSGHTEDGEDVRAAVIREAEEEVGLTLAPDDLRVALVMQHRGPGGTPRIGWFFEAADGAGGTAVNREPDKCSGLGWYALAALPDDMVAYCRAGLDAYRAGERFVIHWHEDGDTIAYEATARRAVPLPTSGV